MLNGVSVSNAFCSELTKVSHVGDSSINSVEGSDYKSATILTDLALDDCCFRCGVNYDPNIIPSMAVKRALLERCSNKSRDNPYYALMKCQHLQRLSTKGATYCLFDLSECAFPPEPIPQGMIIEMFCHHPTLRWLRSDLATCRKRMSPC